MLGVNLFRTVADGKALLIRILVKSPSAFYRDREIANQLLKNSHRRRTSYLILCIQRADYRSRQLPQLLRVFHGQNDYFAICC